MERVDWDERHLETSVKLQNLRDENLARGEKLKWLGAREETAEATPEPAPDNTDEAVLAEAKPRARFHAQAYASSLSLSATQAARLEWRQGWRQSGGSQVPGMAHLLAHLSTAHTWSDETGSKTVHTPFDGCIHIAGARQLKSG